MFHSSVFYFEVRCFFHHHLLFQNHCFTPILHTRSGLSPNECGKIRFVSCTGGLKRGVLCNDGYSSSRRVYEYGPTSQLLFMFYSAMAGVRRYGKGGKKSVSEGAGLEIHAR
ncbi:unnamed protein product [Ectocarpus sp. 13 AM-2016]